MDRLMAMKVFCEVAATGSFTAAADRLEMSRVMVSRYVESLESWLGVRLIQRTTRRLALTDAGERCLQRAQQLHGVAEALQQEVRTDAEELSGLLRLTCSVSFAYAQLATALAAFLQQHPALKIDVKLGDQAVNLLEERIDLAIRISQSPDPGLVSRPLAICDSVMVASPAYLRLAGTPAHPDQLAQHSCISHSHFGRDGWTLSHNGQTQRFTVPVRLTMDDATSLMQAAIAGAGIALLPAYLVNPVLREGQLISVLSDWQAAQIGVYALYPSRRHLAPAVRALLDFLVQRFEQRPW
ncbi:LysR family transcriptional regulator [Undibacterium squillarum]|uniref:LysR family transcriptional regulator n=1 Tax=Undibacterium squillarum TaxID=1131567 RepID=A0ABQ2XUM4_9BURK|nr:LysR family transcriptional regulator [Undibacterium squillarum]GGX32714.1 LysR family transcriptional regulator [Undibacterium squillarum]